MRTVGMCNVKEEGTYVHNCTKPKLPVSKAVLKVPWNKRKDEHTVESFLILKVIHQHPIPQRKRNIKGKAVLKKDNQGREIPHRKTKSE